MKASNKLKILSLFILILIGTSCEKEEPLDLTGNLVVNIGSNKTYLSKTRLPNIYIADSDISEPLVENISVVEKNFKYYL